MNRTTPSVIGRTPVALLFAVLLPLSACRTTAATAAAPAPAAAPSADARQAELAAIEKARADSVRYPYTAADVRFMAAMVAHHSQAIAMSQLAPTHGASRSVQILAERIINAQQDEIVTIQRWLRDRRQPVPEAKPGPMKMMMNGVEHEMMMPGMLTAEQTKQLDAARGLAFDRLFLTFMIQHHRGAVSMVKELLGTYGAAQDATVFRFATDVSVDQSTEIARMERMLAALPPAE